MSRPSAGEFEFLFRQLAMAAHAGLPLREVLAIVRKDGTYPSSLVAGVGQLLDAGRSLSEALAAAGPAFPRATVEFVRTAEDKAMLPSVLEALAVDYSRRAAGGRALRRAIYWPATLTVVLMVVLSMAMIFVIPAFKAVFADLGADLPAPTRLLVHISDFLFSDWIWIALLALIAAVAFLVLKRRAVLWLPLIHPFWEKLFQLRLATMLALAAGAEPSLAAAACAHLGATAPTARAARWIDSLSTRLAAGTGLLRAALETPPVPPRVAAMLELGSRTGNLAGARAYIDKWCDAEFDDALPRFEADLLMVTYVLIGVSLATIVMALYLPVFRLGAAI